MKFGSITQRIFIILIPTIIITTLSFAVLSYNISSSRINDTINAKMAESLRVADLQIQLELSKNAAVAEYFAGYGKTLDIAHFGHESHKDILKERILSTKNTFGGGVWFKPYGFDSNSYYFGPFLYTLDDREVVYIPNYGDIVDYFAEDWYVKGENSGGELVWSKAYYDPVSTKTMVTASKPFYDTAGNFAGMGTADMNLENISKIVNEISVGQTGKAFVIGSSGEYISFYDEAKSINDTMQTDSEEALATLGKELVTNKSGITSLDRHGKKHRVYYTTMDNINWTLAVTVEESEISSSALYSFIITTIIPVAGLLLVILGVFLITNYLKKIVNKVNNFADMAASGDFTKRIVVSENDEFGIMEQNLNTMISKMSDMSRHSAELLKVAEDASKSKSEFLSRMSHEIRTPMNAVIGMTQIAKSSNDPEKIKDCLNKVDGASKHLLALINDILDMSKIEANKLEISQEEFNPEVALMDVYDMVLIKAEEKAQQLTVSIDKNVPVNIIGDELRFCQVITNLVGNAIKFTPEKGNISIHLSEVKEEDEVSTIQVNVSDNGIGLSQEQQARLFKSFEQGDGSISRKFGGTGLGLAISVRLVEMMGGTMWVESELGKGSTFTFTIKAKRGNGITNNVKAQMNLLKIDSSRPIKILVVDDSPEANEYMKHVLNTLTFECDSVFNGNEALNAVKKAIEENIPYDIIFMDYLMPGMNGIDTAREIMRVSNESSAIIMVSIYDWKDIEREALSAGIIKHITKPFSPSCVLDTINDVTSGAIKSVRAKPKPETIGLDGGRILLAEDIDINREIIAALLEDTKITIEYAENGKQAVDMFSAEPEKYDLILMDIQMPEMDGYEATRQIRTMDIRRGKTIPIIAMTANALSEDVKRCLDAGMNDHLAKPIDYDTLLIKLNDYFFMKDYLNNEIW